MATSQFSCSGCGKSYAWKPEIAGKRVKCKCGERLNVPATDPAAVELEAEPMPEGFDDLMALADGAPVSEASYAPEPAVAAAAPARPAKRSGGGAAVAAVGGGGAAAGAAAGGACPSCGARVDAAAVLCVNCGHNLKTGKKLKTSKLSGEAAAGGGGGGGGADALVPGYRSFGVKDVAGAGMSPQKKKMMAIGLSVVLVGLIVGIVAIVMMGLKNDREHQAKLNAKPAKLEKMIENMDKAGGIGAAMHDGTLLEGVRDPARENADVLRAKQRDLFKIKNRCDELVKANGPDAKAWLTATPKGRLCGHDNAQSIAIVEQLAALGATEIHTSDVPADDNQGHYLVPGLIAKLPTTPAARKQVFDWYENLPKMIEANDQPHQTDMGQTHISVEFKAD
jgi:hypothetical protein